MRKKNNPEKESPTTEEQETETPAEETEQPLKETEQEQPADEQEDPAEEEDEIEEPASDKPDEEPHEEQPRTPAQEQPTSDEMADLRRQLLEARGRNAAYAAGVATGMVDDAVTLAMAEAAKSGEVTEATVTKAMDAVLKRHPEWKSTGNDKPKGGFRLGADRDNAGAPKKQTTTQNVKRWNRFK